MKLHTHSPRYYRHMNQVRREVCKPKAPPKPPLRCAPKRRDSPYRPLKEAPALR